MATNTTTSQSTARNLESFACFWLDQAVDSTEDNRTTQRELRQVINHLRTFDNSDECQQQIQQISQEKVILIISGSLGRQIVPRLHDLPQFSACYVFCGDQKVNEQWANNYQKVKGVFVQRAKLVTALAEDQVARSKVEDGASISVISCGSESLQSRNAIFMWFQLFIEVLLRMHHKSSDRKELIDICKNTYTGNDREMNIIGEFEKTYRAENAIWWYTRESCFYRMMNHALRVQDYDILFALRFFITDIAKQIKSEYERFIRNSDTNNVIRVYRGQVIGSDELELMKNSVGELLSMNSFLSTSRNRATAVDFARTTTISGDNQRILFEIEINTRLETKAFADVNQMSYFHKEDEILIMLGALFHIEKVAEDKNDRLWVARVLLASEDDYHLKETFAHMKEKIDDDTNLDSLGKILHEMGEYEEAEKCYRRMMHDLQLSTADCHMGLGREMHWLQKYQLALPHYEDALKMRQEVLGEDHATVGESYKFIGTLYYRENDYDQALVNLKKAIEILEKASSSDPHVLATTYNDIAVTYKTMGDTHLSTEYHNKALNIRRAILPPDHPDIAMTYHNLGCLYAICEDYETALEYYQKSLDISRKILPPKHGEIVRTEDSIAHVKVKMEQ